MIVQIAPTRRKIVGKLMLIIVSIDRINVKVQYRT